MVSLLLDNIRPEVILEHHSFDLPEIWVVEISRWKVRGIQGHVSECEHLERCTAADDMKSLAKHAVQEFTYPLYVLESR